MPPSVETDKIPSNRTQELDILHGTPIQWIDRSRELRFYIIHQKLTFSRLSQSTSQGRQLARSRKLSWAISLDAFGSCKWCASWWLLEPSFKPPRSISECSLLVVYWLGTPLGELIRPSKRNRANFKFRGMVATVPIYLSEISAPQHRGLIGGISGCGISFGTMMSNVSTFSTSF